MSFLAGLLVRAAVSMAAVSDSLLYSEKYRPQYHFTPAHHWIGDPCGTIRHNGRYLAYSWGAAQSDDLLHWTEINDHAIKGLPKGTAAFTGSVVADRENSAGYSHTYVFHVYVSRASF